ncbi:uncharacterized protein BT62DRAFT_1008993 [Guyanagaster necrorhizus]|uniref:Uncharacterized protein n=1 Tax=Guyanagaster necrorhizus TaxID=856835 RepID=A0A9P7VN74_9AGAR|nr:uncharacterized protein BT62DRAFT_1008993 [Guyanagaster necrorhizus MCA 3950]KAG7443633.1 hypothetical protein BT62DRAFT_1008993 [Guyanagaster necrorhizus MCA 3950]
MSSVPATSATQAKDRLYAQLASSLGRLNRSISTTADLCEQLQIDLQAMRTFAGLDAAKFIAIASQLNQDVEGDTSVISGGDDSQ